MAQLHTIQTNFASGELDPTMAFRSDTGAYQNGAARLKNVLLLSTGGARRRWGTDHLATEVGRTRLLPFEFSAGERYVLALSNTRLDVYSLTGSLLGTVTGCTWGAAELFELSYAQVADVMIVCHQSWRPQVIRRTGPATFTVSAFAFDQSADGNKIYQPYFKFADDSVRLSAAATTGSTTITASSGVFAADLVGERLRWEDVEIEITAYTNATTLTGTVKGTLKGNYDINPFRTEIGSAVVEVTHVGHGFSTGDSVTIAGANGVGGIVAANLAGTFTVTLIDDNRYSITVAAAATESVDGGGPNVTFTGAALATRNWAEPVFCTRNGWPGAVAFHEGRLWFGGTRGVPDGLWSSKTYLFFNFDVGDGLDTDAIAVTVGSEDISNIRHLISHRELQIFTPTGEFYAPPPQGGGLTPANMRVRRQTPYGASMVTPLPLDGATLYVQASGKAVREFIYSDGEDGYTSTNLNILSSHIINTPHDMAVLFGSSERTEQYALLVNGDGTMAVFHSARAESLAGWTSWEMGDGSFDAVCVLGGEVFLSVNRAGSYRLEKINPDSLLDGRLSYTAGSATAHWTVGAIFYNRTVHVTSGGYSLGTYTVGPTGALTLDAEVDTIDVGYAFEFEIETLPVNMTLPNGPTFGLPKRINRVIAALDTTLAVSISGNRLELRQVTDDFSTEPQAFTGTKEFYLLGYGRNPTVTVTQTEPLDCTVLGLLMEVTS